VPVKSRRQPPVKSGRRLPLRTGRRDWLWGVALVTVVLCVLFVVFFVALKGSSGKAIDTVDGVDCQVGEQLQYHVHAALEILVDGQPVTVPKNTGIRSNCIFWLHTHDDTGLLHIEAPEKRDFTLGQFFAVWGQPLSATQLLSSTVDASHKITATVNGTPFTGDPASIPLADQETIVLQYGPPFGTPAKSIFQ
jgi:hypothetical protein